MEILKIKTSKSKLQKIFLHSKESNCNKRSSHLKKVLFIIFYIIFFCSCDELSVSNEKDALIKNDNWSDNSVSYFISKTPLAEVFSEEYYQIRARFSDAHSRIELFSHFRGFNVADGIKILFKRHEQTLIIKVSVQGYKEQVLLEDVNYFSSTKIISWTIAVENGTDYGFRVRVWENFINKNNILKTPTKFLVDENLIVDSLPNLTFYTKGHGLYWGLKLFRAQFIEAYRVSPRAL